MSSLWFSSTKKDANNTADSVIEHSSNLTDICTAATSVLPLVTSANLTFDKTLGKGSTFIVNREVYGPRFSDEEPYYVAVKHMIMVYQSPRRVRQHYDKVMRELRVLTHPSLKNNQYILTLLAYGWTDSHDDLWPYLVVDYADHGTLNEHLSSRPSNWNERLEFCVDVTLGLKALHDCNIIHGDVKPSNLLVFGAWGTYRSSLAKISDFGGAIFDLDDNRMIGYGGTNIYNAPEQEQRGRYKSQTLFSPKQLYQADIYSFGLTIWEIVKKGKNYIDDDWLSQGETRIEFLNRIHEEEEDPLLGRAEAFCDDTFSWQPLLSNVFWKFFYMTLRDEASRRYNMTKIADYLTQYGS